MKRICLPGVWLFVACLPAGAAPATAQEGWIDAPMYRDPDLSGSPVEYTFPDRARELWLKALEQPQADLRCRAADALVQAQRRGVQGLSSTVPALITALDREGQHPAVRLAVARTLVELDARQAAASLWRQARAGGIDLREVIEPTLARWDHAPARSAWLARLDEPTTPQRKVVLAIRGLAVVREIRAVDRLRERVLSNHTAGPIRLEAARALGRIRPQGMEKDAQALLADPSPRGLPARLAAASLLRHHGGASAVGLLQTLAKDREPVVAAVAAARLIEIDPTLASGARDGLLASRDPRLRSFAVDILHQHATPDSLALLIERLDDPHPNVRGKARGALFERAARRGQRRDVIGRAGAALATKRWRTHEQAIMLLTDLGHKPAAGRMVELLAADRPEVFVTAACGLRRLAEPTSLPAALAYLEAEQKRFSGGEMLPGRQGVSQDMIDHQLSQLLQLMGQKKYVPALGVMRNLVPRNPKTMCYQARSGAIWALGLVHESTSVADMADALEARLNDAASIPPEALVVRLMSAVTLGRLKKEESLGSLRKFCVTFALTEDPVNNACAWAIGQITDKPVPVRKPPPVVMRNWFLSPRD